MTDNCNQYYHLTDEDRGSEMFRYFCVWATSGDVSIWATSGDAQELLLVVFAGGGR